MNTHNLIKPLLLLSCLFLWYACTDEQDTRNLGDEPDVFFDASDAEPNLKTIVNVLKQRNDSLAFASEFSRKYGQPLWNKAFCFLESDGMISYAVPFIRHQDAEEVSALWFFLQNGKMVQSGILSREDVTGELSDLRWTFDYATRYALMKTPSSGLIFNKDTPPVKTRIGTYYTYTRCNHVISYVEGTNIYDDHGYYCWTVTEYLTVLPDIGFGLQQFYSELSKGPTGG